MRKKPLGGDSIIFYSWYKILNHPLPLPKHGLLLSESNGS